MKVKLLVDLANKKAGDIIEAPFGYEFSLISRGIAEKIEETRITKEAEAEKTNLDNAKKAEQKEKEAEAEVKKSKGYTDLSGKEYTKEEVDAMDKRTNLYKEIIATSK